MTKPLRAWWFAPDNDKLRYGDGRKPRKNHSHRVSQDKPLALCEYGLHASVRAMDALSYAPGSQAWRVELRGPEILRGNDKAVAYERRYIAKVPNCDAVLRHFARLCALDVIGNWKGDVPDVVMRWLRTGDESLRRAARDAAFYAARDAAFSAARSAADSAAYSVASYAARDAAYSAAYEKQDTRLHRMLVTAIREGR